MIRFQITGQNPVEMNTVAKVLTDHPRLEIDRDSGNRNGRKSGYIRYVHVKIKREAEKPKRPEPKFTQAARLRLAEACWQRIIHKTDGDIEAVQAIVELIEHVERKLL